MTCSGEQVLVSFWHLADMPIVPMKVRYCSKSSYPSALGRNFGR